MAIAQPVTPVKLIVAILWSNTNALASALEQLAARWGSIDFQGLDHPFDSTDYYDDEMGSGLLRRIVAYEELVVPESIVAAKLFCNDVEDSLRKEPGRQVNLDIGYLDHNKIVLASLKYAGQKIHLGDGVYADLIGRYEAGAYQPFPWTFPDFKGGRYQPELSSIRNIYLQQLRNRPKS